MKSVDRCLQRVRFFHLQEANETIQRFVYFYNGERLHSGIRYLSPNQYFYKLGLNMPPHYQEDSVEIDYSKNVNCTSLQNSIPENRGLDHSTYKQVIL
ncbi:IS3 family transposase [Telluribacter sp. SYSU D00476]|uniref:IS3 family transposase n=1 Tax=Telluribacter sp. SYSU D00476 TaxID=2811430 RepID=UPI0038F81453